MLNRFNYTASNIEEALAYYHNRLTQVINLGWSWDGSYVDLNWGIEVPLIFEGKEYQSVYVFDKNNGHLLNWFSEGNRNFVTTVDCKATYGFLTRKNISFTIIKPRHNNSYLYNAVSDFYGDRKAERTGVFYMNHIDEGLYILSSMRASSDTKACYEIHPLFQSDSVIQDRFLNSKKREPTFSSDHILLGMEYRNIANAYLPSRTIKSIDEFNLSPLEEVNDALRADKIQNRKDFEKYHLGKHPNSDNLVQYFKNWFEKLGIEEGFYNRMVHEIESKTGVTR